MEKRSNKKDKNSLEKFITNKSGSLNIEKQTDLFLENKINLLEDFIENLKNKFIFKKITDVSANIRSIISDYISKISENYFSNFFDNETVKFFSIFLIDPSDKIKSKYLQIIYEKLDNINETDFECIIKILKESRDLILNICIREEKRIAKKGIRIIELISKHNILDSNTVNLLIPHLFNPDPSIRELISNVVLNYILNFEKRDVINEEDENNNEEEDYSQINKSKLKKNERDLMEICENNEEIEDDSSNNKANIPEYRYSLENLIEIFEFFFKLTEKDDKMIKVLVDNFYPKMKVFRNFSLFFDFIDLILSKSNFRSTEEASQEAAETDNYSNVNFNQLLKVCLLVLKYSIEKLQDEIDNAKNSADVNNIMKDQIPINEDFLNNLISRTPAYIRKIIINEDVFYETFVEITNLFENFKIYNYNLVKFDKEKIYDILEELQKVFFYNFILKNKNDQYYSHDNFLCCSIENIGKIIIKLINFLSINKMNNEISTIYDNEKNIIRELSSKLYEKISEKILQNKSFLSGDAYNYNILLSECLSNEEAENLIYLIVRFDCILNYFGSFNDSFISKLDFLKFQNFIFNVIKYYREKIQININERILLFEKYNQYGREKGPSEENKQLQKEIEKLDFAFRNNEFFLQYLVNCGFKLLKSLKLFLLNKTTFLIDSFYNINNSNNTFTNIKENEIFLNASLEDTSKTNKFDIYNNNNSLVSKSEIIHYYDSYQYSINNLFENFQKFLDYEFNYTNLDLNISIKNFTPNKENLSSNLIILNQYSKLIQEKNNINLEIKSNFLCLILELMIYISSEKLEMYCYNTELKLKFQINDSIIFKIEKFLKKEFVFFFFASSKKLRELNDEIKTVEIQQEKLNLEDEKNEDSENDTEKEKLELIETLKKTIENEISVKTIFFKNICENFSKLIIQNLAVFKNRNLVSLFFETFYLIKFPLIIESINNIVYENLIEKEISYYLKDEENNKVNWMIFYFTKIAVKLFSKNSSMYNFTEFAEKEIDETEMEIIDKNKDYSLNEDNLKFNFYYFFSFSNFSYLEKFDFLSKRKPEIEYIIINEEEKLNMLKRYFDVYLKNQRAIKNLYSKDFSKSIEKKDKKFLEEFICKSINYSLQSKVMKEILIEDFSEKFIKEKTVNEEISLDENINDDAYSKNSNLNASDKKDKKYEKRIYIENIKFLELIRYLMKNLAFISDIEFKTFLMLFVKLSKSIETTDNVNRSDIKIIETMKNYLLSKAKLFINTVENKNDDSQDEEDKNSLFEQKELDKKNENDKTSKKSSKKPNKSKKNLNANLESGKEESDFEKEKIDEEQDEEEIVNSDLPKYKKNKTKKVNKKNKNNEKQKNTKFNKEKMDNKINKASAEVKNLKEKMGKKRKHGDVITK